MAALILSLLLISAVSGNHEGFHYTTSHRPSSCNVCSGADDTCSAMEPLRCHFYMTSSLILEAEETPDNSEVPDDDEIRSKVDSMLITLVNKAPKFTRFFECIPYVSTYTDCTKESICTGCTACTCGAAGYWRCSPHSRCTTQGLDINIDHRALLFLAHNIHNSFPEDGIYREKRSVDSNESPFSEATLTKWWLGEQPITQETKYTREPIYENENKISVREKRSNPNSNNDIFEEMANWMYGDQVGTVNFRGPVMDNNKFTSPKYSSTDGTTTKKPVTSKISPENKTHPLETDNVDFEDVLQIINVNESHNSRAVTTFPPYTEHFDTDYFNFDLNEFKKFNSTEQFLDLLNNIEKKTSTYVPPSIENKVTDSTQVYVDLLVNNNSYKENKTENIHAQSYSDIDGESLIPVFVGSHEINRVKRNASELPDPKSNSTTTEESTHLQINNLAASLKHLEENVLHPLNNIVNEKEIEIKRLLSIRANLVNYLNHFNDYYEPNETNSIFNNTTRETDSLEEVEDNIEEFATSATLDKEMTENNEQLLPTFLDKLKTDIYDVIKDIATIQKLSKSHKLPEELKVVIRGLKYYVHSQEKKDTDTLTRRFPAKSEKTFGDQLLDIIDVLNHKLPESNAFGRLSPATKRIMYRIFRNYYDSEFDPTGLNTNTADQRINEDLKHVGDKWHYCTLQLLKSDAFTKLYALKKLYLILKDDIYKMTDALSIIKFSESRRMLFLHRHEEEKYVAKITDFLKNMSPKLDKVLQNYKIELKPRVINNPQNKIKKITQKIPIFVTKTQTVKKKSFLDQVWQILKDSKKDIITLLHKKTETPKAVPVMTTKMPKNSKQVLSNLKQTMEKWQKKLKIAPRSKRSPVVPMRKRMKNIIPNYLKGKVPIRKHKPLNHDQKVYRRKKGAKRNPKNRRDQQKNKGVTTNRAHSEHGTTTTAPKTPSDLVPSKAASSKVASSKAASSIVASSKAASSKVASSKAVSSKVASPKAASSKVALPKAALPTAGSSKIALSKKNKVASSKTASSQVDLSTLTPSTTRVITNNILNTKKL